MKHTIALLLFFVLSLKSYAQQVVWVNSVVLNYGTHYQRIGIKSNIAIYRTDAQWNSGLQYTWNRKSIIKKNMHEVVINSGVQLGFGNTFYKNYNEAFLSRYSNFLEKDFGIGYTYLYYVDSRKTSQAAGLIQLQYKKWQLCTQNDGAAFFPWDEYRTGSAHLIYEDSLYRVSLNTVQFTGSTRKYKTIRSTDAKINYGIKDYSEGSYSNASAGLLFFGLDYALPLNQYANLQAGIDHEKIRYALQSKLIHNSILLHKINPKIEQLMIPMLDANGKLVLDAKTKPRKGKVFIQGGFGGELAY